MEQLGCQWTDFYGIFYLSIFGNLPRKFKFQYNLTKMTDALHENLRLAQLFLE